jgi:hypothetical protein
MTLGNMRANGVRSLDVSCWQCHHRAILSADPWPDHAPVPIRSAHGVHPMWHQWRGRPAALAGATGEPDGDAMAMTVPIRGITGKQRSALVMLAGCPGGCTEAAMKASGFGIGLLATLIRAGLAVATPGVVQAGGRTLSVVRITITEMGRGTVGA